MANKAEKKLHLPIFGWLCGRSGLQNVSVCDFAISIIMFIATNLCSANANCAIIRATKCSHTLYFSFIRYENDA